MTVKRVAIHTLGCKVNQNEAEAMAGLFREAGYQVVDFDGEADVYVIHTCTVTHLGDRKSRQVIRRAVRQNPEAVVVVSGCYAQVAPGEVMEIPGVDLVIGTQHRARIVELAEQVMRERQPLNAVQDILRVQEFEELPVAETGRVRAFMKIQEGCQNFCTYCIIPFARGPVRSRRPEKVLEEAQRLVNNGYKEIVLTGICTGAYGRDLGEGIDLNRLLLRLKEIPGLLRIRISSLDPNDFTPDLIDTLTGDPVFCPHLHISLQSGNDKVLKDMRRQYTTAYFARLLQALRSRRPRIAVTTDIMVGFPGETEAEHESSLAFVEKMELAGLHVFKYSQRKGTKAYHFPGQVPYQVKEKRSHDFLALDKKLRDAYARSFLGETLAVLVETGVDGGCWEGHTGNYLKVRFPAAADLRGQMVQVRLEEAVEDFIMGSLV
ncbi:MAG TPA: tRNA (N(6)-L-threonylcarbamoyladenosine(37)-C(2))-methylthiotransferase MtaB [Clostridia bacterium]|nr:tRNA (N(6)-L-threonylcarbamoyladenosine(37)-C(2))-methylthiotransferase MtaB [Clostridia bacterium]